MKWFSLVSLLVVFSAMSTVNSAGPTVADLVGKIVGLVTNAIPFFAQFVAQLSMPVLDPTKDYTSVTAIAEQLTQLIETFKKFGPYLVWIVQPGNAKTPVEIAFAGAVTEFANVLPQINELLSIILTNIANASG